MCVHTQPDLLTSAQVTLHSVLGEAELAPHLDTLTGPKRKLLSLYILRQNQQI